MTVVCIQSHVHSKHCERTQEQQDPKSIDQVNFDPESNDNQNNHQIIDCENQAPERVLTKI